MLTLPDGGAGVLPNHLLSAAIDAGVIDAGRFKIPTDNVQPASLDLRLGEVAYRIRCSFLPGKDAVEDRLGDLMIDRLDLRGDGVVLETNRPYLIPLKEELRLPAGVRAKANPKSSTGRLDVFTRVITDRSYLFDEVEDGYQGKLYLEVVPLSFTVRVREDVALNQLRLSVGRSELSDAEIREYHRSQPLLYLDGTPVSDELITVSNGLFLSLDLRGSAGSHVGYRAREHAPLLDIGAARDLDPEPWWEPVKHESGDRVVLTEKKFYLLMSQEAVAIPPSLASEMTAYDPTSGELRTHYAGFFDPGFGYDAEGGFRGSRAALEVRAHDVPFMIEHGQRVCKLTFERMLEPPTILYGAGSASNYQGQTEALGKHFSRSGPQPGGA
jgi:dCTP deaminase